ncbi:hypothetical protein AVEN_255031-1 [Araneus ventricosus]|uniref:Uncharacterized protein n=1 Tax=Araneus ventricosus TaxID=182803 RepID=A0A4Y2LXB4_ARAVE|nr:hypothetical protein AVEN_255031-1 [Araneus ventricosus]
MPLRTRIRQYKQIIQFERGRDKGCEKVDFLCTKWKKDMAGMHPLCMIDGGVIRHHNACSHIAAVTQCAPYRIDMLPWLARSSDLILIEHVWHDKFSVICKQPELLLI